MRRPAPSSVRHGLWRTAQQAHVLSTFIWRWYRLIACMLTLALIGNYLAHPPIAEARGLGTILLSRTNNYTYAYGDEIWGYGSLAFVVRCSERGTADIIGAVSDIWLVPKSGLNLPEATPVNLEGAGGTKIGVVANTIGTTFDEQPLGMVAKSMYGGDMNRSLGEYYLVADHCQDGDFEDGTDYLSELTLSVASAGAPNSEQIQMGNRLKNYYAERAKDIILGAKIIGIGFFLLTALLIPLAIANPVAVVWATVGAGLLAAGIAASMALAARTYQTLADDPPDPAYRQVSTLPSLQPLPSLLSDPLVDASMDMGISIQNEGAVAEMMLHSIERYQGAQLDGRLDWQLVHARAIRSQIDLLKDQISGSDARAQNLSTTLGNDARPLNTALAQLETARVQMTTNGLTPAELLTLRGMGFSTTQIDQALDTLGTLSFDTTVNGMRSDLAKLQTSGANLRNELDLFAAHVDDLIAQIEADPRTGDTAPVADAGGPYTATVGQAMSLSASATSPVAVTSYQWDLDGDGAFDDATGATPTVTFPYATEQLIGVRATNAYGLSNVDFSRVRVSGSNRSPRFLSASPWLDDMNLEIGETWPVSVSVDDPDGDPVSVQWLLDDVPVGNGLNYTYTATSADIGVHRLQAVATNPQPSVAPARKLWVFGVGGRDVDGDGWRSHLDCNDTDAAINPGKIEVLGNGKDDDCNPATTDTGGAPVVAFVPQGGGRNVALAEAGATVHSSSSQASSSAAAVGMLDYSATTTIWRTALGKNTNQWAIINLVGGKTYQIDRVKLMPGTGNEGVKNFTVAVATASPDGPYTTVLTATAALNGALQEYMLPAAVQAKYVKLTAINSQNATSCCIDVRQFKVYTTQEGSRTVTFMNQTVDSDNDIVRWAWDFGDGTTSSDRQPTHTYPETSRTYSVSLTVTDRGNNVVSYTLPYRVLLPPVARFTVTPASPEEAVRGTYTDSSTDPDGEGMLATRTWTWGTSSATAPSASINQTFFNSGTILVKLQVIDKQEQVSTVEQTVTIANVPPTLTPAVDQTIVWGQPMNVSSVLVNDLSDVDRAALTCVWSFGDGTGSTINTCNSTKAQVAHAYATPGNYTATLSVSDPDGGTTTRTTAVQVQKRTVIVQALNVRPVSGGQIEVTAKAFDRYTWAALSNWNLSFAAGGATVSAQTAANGTVTVVVPRAPATDILTITAAGTPFYHVGVSNRPIEAPMGDIVFIVDESGSMKDDQADLERNLTSIVVQLSDKVDFRIGIVGFGAARPSHGTTIEGQGHIELPFSNDVGQIGTQLRNLVANGGYEAGFDGTRVAMSNAMGFRSNAGTCAVLISDDWSDFGGDLPTTREQAVAALKSRNAIFLGIVYPGIRGVADHYGMNPGSLGAETGGAIWHINDFRTNPQPVLDAITERCLAYVTRVDLDVSVTDGLTSVRAGEDLTYTLTVRNTSTGLARDVALADTLPTGTTFVGASNGGTVANGTVTWPVFDLAAGQSITRTLTVHVGAQVVSGSQLTTTATVTDNGASGPDRTPANNTASDTTTVERPLNTPPVANNQQLITSEDTALPVVLSASDAEQNALSYVVASQPRHGTLSGTAPNLLYTPAPNVYGTDSFTFFANDGSAASATATISIEVKPINDRPTVTTAATYTVLEGGAVVVQATAQDLDGDPLVLAWDLDHDGSYETTGEQAIFSAATINGPAVRTISVSASDGTSTSSAEATINIQNGAPHAQLDSDTSVNEGRTITVRLSNADDPSPDDAATLHYIIACDGNTLDGATYATASSNPTATCTFDDGPTTRLVRARVIDRDGAMAEYTTSIDVLNVAPTAVLAVPAEATQGTTFVLALNSAADVSQADTGAGLRFAFDCGDGAGWSAPADQPTITCNAATSGVITVKGRVEDKDGGITEYTASVVASTLPPVVRAPVVAPAPSDEGASVVAQASFSSTGNAQFTCTIDYGDGSGPLAGTVQNQRCVGPAHIYRDNGTYTVAATVSNQSGSVAGSTTTHTVNNLAPVLGSLSVPATPQPVGTSVRVTTAISDAGVLDTHTAFWNWGDGTTQPGTVASTNGAGSATATHTYSKAGVYAITLTVTDKDGDSATATSTYVVVYDPGGGFVTGGGWVESPAGAYLADQTATGRANVGFNARYKQGNVPTGQTEFQFQTGNLNFHSQGYEWLVVDGVRAQYKGTGTVNGQGGYGFVVTVVDQPGGDMLRMKIWQQSTGTLIYDTQPGAPDTAMPALKLSGGSIVVHTR